MPEISPTVSYRVRLRLALAAVALALVLLYAVGFADARVLAGVTGAARHALGFPGL